MHILIIPSEFFDDQHKPLAGIFQKDQAELLINRGNEVGVLAVKPCFTSYELLNATINRKRGYLKFLGLSEAWLLFFKKLLLPTKLLFTHYHSNKLRIVKYNGGYAWSVTNNCKKRADWLQIGNMAFDLYLKKFGKPDIIHAHNILFGGMLGRCLSKKYQIPLLYTEHSSTHKMKVYSKADFNLIQDELNKVDWITAVSPDLGRIIQNKYGLDGKQIDWLPNVMNKSFELNSIEIEKSSLASVTFLNIASLIPIKHQSLLIDAFSKAFKGNANVFLEIAGGGVLEEQLKTQIHSLRMEERILLLGALNRKQILARIKKSDVLVHSSDYETFGVVLIEALALGKPVLSTACGGPECIVNDTNGPLVPVNNATALAEGMIQVLEKLEDFNAIEIKKDLVDRFGEDAFYALARKFYNRAINAHLY